MYFYSKTTCMKPRVDTYLPVTKKTPTINSLDDQCKLLYGHFYVFVKLDDMVS